jgi:acyl-CoA reductase-like NAD-dependent aldehyde dehydrogenase
MEMYVNGQWRSSTDSLEIRSPYNGEVMDTAPCATTQDAEDALAAAVRGAQAMAALTAYERQHILERGAAGLAAAAEDLAVTISREAGKPHTEARGEANRAAGTRNVHINWTPLWRADFMPYGGFKASGIGKEGPRYAIEEMTELKTVVIHGLS